MLKPRHDLITAGRLLILALIVTMTNTVRAEAQSVNPFQIALNGSMAPGTEGVNLDFDVPPGKTLVIEYVSADCFVPAGQTCNVSIFTRVNGDNQGIQFNLDSDRVGAFGRDVLFRVGQQVLLYADGGKTVIIRADRNLAAGSATFFPSLSGHLQ